MPISQESLFILRDQIEAASNESLKINKEILELRARIEVLMKRKAEIDTRVANIVEDVKRG